MPPNQIIALVTQDGCSCQQTQHPRQTQQLGASHRTHHKQQRVTRQKRHHHQTSFNKHYQKQDSVNPHAIGLHKRLQVAVDVEDEVEK